MSDIFLTPKTWHELCFLRLSAPEHPTAFNTFIKRSSSHVVEAQSSVHVIYVLQESEEVLHLLKCQPLGQRKDTHVVMGKGDHGHCLEIGSDSLAQSCSQKGIHLHIPKTQPWNLRMWAVTWTFVPLLLPSWPNQSHKGKRLKTFPM